MMVPRKLTQVSHLPTAYTSEVRTSAILERLRLRN